MSWQAPRSEGSMAYLTPAGAPQGCRTPLLLPQQLRRSCITPLPQLRNAAAAGGLCRRKSAQDLGTLVRPLGSCRDERGHTNEIYGCALLVRYMVKARDNLHMIINAFQHLHRVLWNCLGFTPSLKKTLSKCSKEMKEISNKH